MQVEHGVDGRGGHAGVTHSGGHSGPHSGCKGQMRKCRELRVVVGLVIACNRHGRQELFAVEDITLKKRKPPVHACMHTDQAMRSALPVPAIGQR